MKKLFDLLLAVVMLFTLITGCTSTPTAEPAAATEAPVSATTQPEAQAATEAPAVEPTQAPANTEAPSAETGSPKVFTYAMTKEPISLDTSKNNDEMSGEVLYHVSEGLLRSYNGQIIPGIAEKWEVSDDGLTYTFHLRDAVWEDGEPVTAQQFEYSFQRFLSPNIAASFADVLYPVVNAKEYNTGALTDVSKLGVKAVDDKTFTITLVHPVPYFLNTIATNAYFYPLRKDFVEKFGDSYAASESSFISDGPFILKKWEHEASLHLVKNPKYWNASAVKLDEIVQLIVTDNNTAVSMYDNGELDYLPDLSAEYTANYPDAKSSLTGSLQLLEFNVAGMTPETGKILSNVNFRKALSYAIDRESLAKAVAGASTQPANRFTEPEIAGVKETFVKEYPISEGLVPVNGDPEKAKEYLANALEELGTTADKLPKLTYVCMESTRHKLYAEAFIDAWKKVLGLNNITITILPVPQAIQTASEKKFDIYLLGMSADTDPYSMLAYWVPDNSINWSSWSDKKYTEMINATNTMLNPEKRFGALLDCEKFLLANGPLEPLFFPGGAYVAKDYVSGLVKSSLGSSTQLIYADINK
jgi:oligopeptide transport system substrate-binding protein